MEPASLVPDRHRVLSGSALKVLATTAMLADHTAARLFALLGEPWLSWTAGCRLFGRLAFPIFSFLLVEGFVHTHDRRRYGIRLLIFALISEVPFDLSRSLTPIDPTYQNVFITLFLGYLGLCAFEGLVDQPALRIVCVLALFVLALAAKCDYRGSGYAMILMLFVLRQEPLASAILGCCLTASGWRASHCWRDAHRQLPIVCNRFLTIGKSPVAIFLTSNSTYPLQGVYFTQPVIGTSIFVYL